MREFWRNLVSSVAPHRGQAIVPEPGGAATVLELLLTAVAMGLGVVLLIRALS